MNLLVDNQPTTASEIIKDNDLTQEEVNMIKSLKHGESIYIGMCKIERPEKITTKKDKKTGKVTFYKNGNKIYPVSISGNIVEFECGSLILI